MAKFSILIISVISLFALCIADEWSEKIDCHFVDKKPSSVRLICDSTLNATYTKDNCHRSLFEDASKNENKAQLVSLGASGCFFVDVDTHFKRIFPNLRELDISSGSVDNFLYFPYWKFDRLEKWNLSHNALTMIPEEYFGSAPRVTELDLSYNRIRDVDPSGFHGVIHLVKVDLSHNRIVKLDDGTFAQQRDLKELDLSHNQLRKIGANAFLPNKKVEFFWTRPGAQDLWLTIIQPSANSISVQVFGNDQDD